jgi:antitoxin VapB
VALSIKTPEADRLARELAAATSESLTEAITIALRERLARVREQQQGDIPARLRRLAIEYSSLPIQDDRNAEEIVGYDADGAPA